VGTCDQILNLINKKKPKLKFTIAYTPENLRLGQAISLYRTPVLPVIGSNDKNTYEILKYFYAPTKVNWQHCNLRTAEMLKHALNTFLALSITFANELGNLCDKVGVDGHRLAQLLKLEPRIGSKAMLMPGLGFSGGTLARDIQTLKQLGKKVGIETVLLNGLWAANQQQNKLITNRIVEYFGGSLKGIIICVLGLTYKPDTSTLRRSAALELIDDLVQFGAQVKASDPMADREELKDYLNFQFFENVTEALTGADVLLLVTPWAEYKTIDFHNIQKNMHGSLVFDAGNLFKEIDVKSAGLEYVNIGGGKLYGSTK
jgi:UDPglucose 6-dehydrogenase